MDTDFVTMLARRLGARVETWASTPGMSGSRIHFTRQADDRPCVLKITSLRGDHARAARRELAFYRDLAGQLPIRTPMLLDAYADHDVIALLLSAHGEVKPARAWERTAWRALASDLARLHGTAIAEPERWQSGRSPILALEEPDLPMVDRFWRDDLGVLLEAVIDNRDLLARAVLEAGECFVQGDCHTENILREDEALVWIDWQSTGIGNPARELGFLNVRATPSGAQVPPEVLANYCRARGIDLERMRRSVIAAELAILLFEWPPYATFNALDGIHRVRRRTRHLAERWMELS